MRKIVVVVHLACCYVTTDTDATVLIHSFDVLQIWIFAPPHSLFNLSQVRKWRKATSDNPKIFCSQFDCKLASIHYVLHCNSNSNNYSIIAIVGGEASHD